MTLDDVIIRIGEFGKYQKKTYVLLCLPVIFCAFHKLSTGFINYEPTTLKCLDETFIPREKISPCKNISYGTDQITTVTEWNLVFDRKPMVALSDSIFMGGVMVGSMIFGGLSDTIGRKLVFTISLIIQLVGGILVAISPNYWSFVLARAIVGTSISGIYLTAYVIATEMVGPSKRRIAGVCVQLFWTIGYVGVAGLAALFPDWRNLQYAITLPSIFFLLYWWLIPESARWLITKGRDEEAKDILQSASIENERELSRDTIQQLLDYNTEKVDKNENTGGTTIIHYLIKYPNIRNKTLFLCLIWIVASGTYYGLSWGASKLNGNPYVIHAISGAIEAPVYLFLILTLDRWGRKKTLLGSMILTGIALNSSALLTNYGFTNGSIAMYMIGKMAITSAYGVAYLFTTEQYPTTVRNMGLGACSTAARIGPILATHIHNLESLVVWLPFVTLGAAAFTSGALVMLLPETLNKKLPETMKDGENFTE
ncbi:hypothetical protein HCN44_006291 [Aphidius gifuensis]|uniref:Major facilitator superfamily (MFS) profile domain-containing protein n=1 Tax=Aphidius gifuensis TaxID=684658 RepID=A0A834XW88_APHGI|nr:organic cation transporter protein-like [Aphidius gifuensis]KAF7993231.1 hypothetical protein HCN44_006291 [Aphidius gifuensis]